MANRKRKIALLRGINVGGKNVIRMAELRSSLEAAGLAEVSTLIQSGNICCESSKGCPAVAKTIQKAIKDDFGYDVPVLVREQSFIQDVIAQSPYCNNGKPKFDIKQLHVTLLGKKPSAKNVKALDDLDFDDGYEVQGDVVYLNIVSGYSKTKLTNGFLEKKLGVPATTRNWKTFCRVAEM